MSALSSLVSGASLTSQWPHGFHTLPLLSKAATAPSMEGAAEGTMVSAGLPFSTVLFSTKDAHRPSSFVYTELEFT